MIGKIIYYLIFILLLAAPSLAQQVTTSVEPNFGMANDSFIFSVIIKGSFSNISHPNLNSKKEFITTSTGTSTRRQIINGIESNEIAFNFELVAREGLPIGEYLTPEGSINIDGTEYEIPPKKINIVESPPENKANRERIKINQFTDKEIAYVGEQITYTVQVISGPDFLGGNLDDIEVLGFWREKLGEQEKKVFNAGVKTITTFQEVLIPSKPGNNKIPSRKLHAQVEGPARRMKMRGMSSILENSFFGGMTMMTRTQVAKDFSTKPIKIEVQPLPKTNIKGYIPVGQLELKSGIDKASVKQGESINLNIKISGSANLRPLEIEKPEVDNFKIYIDPTETKVEYQKARVKFTKNFKIILIPNISGELEIPKFKFNYFDPSSETYKTLETEAYKVISEGNFDNRTIEDNHNTIEEPSLIDTNEILSSTGAINLRSSVTISLLVSLLAILSSVLLYLRKNQSIKEEPAFDNAIKDLDAGNDLITILKNFINSKYKINAYSLTLKEIQSQIINTKIKDSNKFNEMIEHLESSKYRPTNNNNSSSINSESLRNEFISMLKELNDGIK